MVVQPLMLLNIVIQPRRMLDIIKVQTPLDHLCQVRLGIFKVGWLLQSSWEEHCKFDQWAVQMSESVALQLLGLRCVQFADQWSHSPCKLSFLLVEHVLAQRWHRRVWDTQELEHVIAEELQLYLVLEDEGAEVVAVAVEVRAGLLIKHELNGGEVLKLHLSGGRCRS